MVFDNGSDESLNYYWLIDELIHYLKFPMILYMILEIELIFMLNGCYDSTSIDFYLKGFDDYFTMNLMSLLPTEMEKMMNLLLIFLRKYNLVQN